ncbi:hypothetical protein ME1_01213 [Bartonella vinsonii subsp. arupensis OK-94-513]|uniref:Uncharacterized protein n=2 Tax=Bartonella vinsonii subsp. arupensis TaxID=110578 RepID=J0QPG2_BARVI|nr:hypothetical protein [Bartonella vinsonii]EJF87611.1 hypothetical protein ME1_01213 [Bartonella vinsonii subsp. arupensis OK-94-513]EJF98692.1 hypothetical protein MEI_00262 [Bartonella vinsonii subsp. arupensis Pm136co]
MMRKFFFAMVLVFLDAASVLASECIEIGRGIAAQKSGVLVRSTPVVKEGRDMCVVVFIVPAHEGEKLRRVEVAVPAD